MLLQHKLSTAPSSSCPRSSPPPATHLRYPCNNLAVVYFFLRFPHATISPNHHHHRLQFLRHSKPPPTCWSAGQRRYHHCRPSTEGPYQFLARSPVTFRLQIGQRQDVVAIDRLKPAIIATDTPAAQPPRRGRPPILRGPHKPPKTPTKSVTFQQPVAWSSTELPPPPPSPHQPRQPPDNPATSASSPPASQLPGGALWRQQRRRLMSSL